MTHLAPHTGMSLCVVATTIAVNESARSPPPCSAAGLRRRSSSTVERRRGRTAAAAEADTTLEVDDRTAAMRRVKHDVRINENAANAHDVVDNKKVSSRWQMLVIGFSHKLFCVRLLYW